MKKLIIFGLTIIALFIVIILLTNLSQPEVDENNAYGTTDLESETAELLDDPNYQNIITPDELEEKLESGEDVTVYFFSPTCQYCREATPRLMPIADDMNVDVQQYNVLEFEQGWNEFNIDATPTLIHFENGEEVARVKGAVPNEQFEQFFNQAVLDE
ncbi:thioredoxin family protein [Aquisalibacillus elongatus]|uniref:Thioredoxin n=1 Tax=Aquisalibacillus elongatus TaxID=485577 RepID=A0A3N5B7X1_9BACI|nr:thioredoxin family protein [Aquisalibacillus elongatus]RPF53179.1 thioredoxin [Aquisalibacillus elongatus]